ncbi:MAG: exodeoxyribonuclease III [Deferrisomatales bacterium]
MKIATWNVNSVRARLDHLLRWLERARPDVLCLQELKVQDADFPADALREAGYFAVVAGQKTYNGVAVLARDEPVDPVIGLAHLPPDHPLNAQRRLLAVTVAGIRVVSAYLPNGEAVGSEKYAYKLEFFRALREYLDRTCSPADPLVLCGDFNVAPEPRDVYDPEAWEGRVLFSAPERAALEELRAFGFVDCFRRHHGEGGRYSWWDYRGGAYWRNQGLRIDHLWATPGLAEHCRGSDVDESPRKWKKPSDHAPVWAELDAGRGGEGGHP